MKGQTHISTPTRSAIMSFVLVVSIMSGRRAVAERQERPGNLSHSPAMRRGAGDPLAPGNVLPRCVLWNRNPMTAREPEWISHPHSYRIMQPVRHRPARPEMKTDGMGITSLKPNSMQTTLPNHDST